MAEVKVTELPPIVLEDFTNNDSFLIVDDGRARRLTKPVFQSWLEENVKGEKGDQGVAGRDGARGVNGRDGRDGSDGLSAYQIAVQNGFVGSNSEWLNSLKGAAAAKGDDGDNGWSPVFKTESFEGGSYLKIVDWVGGEGDKPSILGYVSESGIVDNIAVASNLKGERGLQGERGEKGNKGDRGDIGAEGVQGEQGLSAYEIAVLNDFEGTEEEWLVSLNPSEVSKAPNNIISKKIDGMFAEAPAYDPETMALAIDALPDKNIMTDAQKDKLEALKTSMYLGTFLTSEDIPLEGAESGNYADVDSGEGVNTERWIYDADSVKFVKAVSVLAGETAESVKEKYESNPDTNAFTDADKLKLDSIDVDGSDVESETAESVKTKYESNPDTNAFTDSLLSKLNSIPEEGVKGAKGDRGEKGANGASAYEIAKTNGFVGTVTEWLSSLKGEKGDRGDSVDSVVTGSGYINFYQASKNSKTPVTTEPTTPAPEAPPVGGINALSEAAFSTEVVGDTGWITLYITGCDTPDWAVTRNGEVIATWNYSHPDVVTKVYRDGTVMSNPEEEYALNMEITIFIGDTTGLVNYKVISNCDYFSYEHEGTFDPFTRVSFSKLPDVKNFRIRAPKSVLTVPNTLPSTVNSLQKSFEGSDNFNDPNVVGWDVSKVSNFNDTFSGCTNFNQPIGVWDMSYARTIDTMFNNATKFNQPISDWNTRYVVSMVGLLSGDIDTYKPPSQDLSMWCVPLLSNYAYSNRLSGLGLLDEHMPIWGTCPRGEDLA